MPLIPLTDETRGIISRELMGAALPGAKMVNTSRMDVVDMPAFRDFVLAGSFHGSLLDCMNSEIDAGIAKDILPYVTFSPHVAGVSVEAQERMFVEIMARLKDAVTV